MMNGDIDHMEVTRQAFLKSAGWGKAQARALAGDASTRRYERLEMAGKHAILMIAPPAAETSGCPINATEDERRALGYNAMARLAGPNLNAFVAVSNLLREAGLSAPEIYAADPDQGYALLEDLGDDLFASAVERVDEQTLYSSAVDALLHLHGARLLAPSCDTYSMLSYDGLALEAEVCLLTEWYWPLKTGAAISDDLCHEYIARWREALKKLSPPHAPALRDFHAENLLWLPSRRGVMRVGVIDFQDALFGHAAYDLVSLLEDARRDVSPELADAMINRYERHTDPDFDKESFRRDYAILAAQRNAKILGIFARLAKRDNKPRYLDLLPRVEAHFRNDLKREPLAPLAAFISKHLPELGV
ncbi:phosphotransferase [Hyphococcus flavus]|uniref:Phosphotransferase n=1 Tax=Hyphococcus flavus TaxID=1866326 RepID=A0AAE9ZCU3_9PROT|nr:phosphotransferase [Hyphococcus flavus]WDI32588.1 phosphotransferase [Hyphococcus flavus]